MAIEAPASPGFGSAAFTWFAELEQHNDRAWFAAHRDVYETQVRGPLEALLDALCDELGGGRVKLFRQHRDTRFSRDKSPYKTRTYGIIGERPASRAALYLELSRPGLFAGTGYYGMAADQLARFRAAVDDEAAGTALQRIVAGVHAHGVETWGEALKTAPRGFARDHPRVGLLRHKMLVAGRRLAPDRRSGAIGDAAARAFARETWAAAEPLNRWLDAHVGESTLPAATRR
jgi:uncharacterized protein (TIGR02453 family)